MYSFQEIAKKFNREAKPEARKTNWPKNGAGSADFGAQSLLHYGRHKTGERSSKMGDFPH